ncbi:MAG: hypothetical protein F4X34_08085 [Chloroflexi bacterium]|nr:hypothetical protein [Chloroflexota bacterium]
MAAKNEDVASAGRAIYKNKILPLMKDEDKGKVVIIDVNSGDYEIDYDDAAAMFRLLERRPDAFTWADRVGYPSVHRMGLASVRQALEAKHD